MAKEKFIVTGDQRDVINRRFEDIMRQLRLKKGSPLNPELVKNALQLIVEGRYPLITNILSEEVHSSFVNRQNHLWIVSDYFIVNNSSNANVRIGSISKDFEKYFGNVSEQVHAPYFIKGRYLRLPESVFEIICEIRKERKNTKIDSCLKGVYGLMKRKQLDLTVCPGSCMSEGLSLENDNVFFVKPVVGSEMRIVILHWYNFSWTINSKSIDEKIEPGSRIFYRVLNQD
jgi:hypothetical protein